MCGRYRQSSPAEALKILFGITDVSFTASDILSPTMQAPVIHKDGLQMMSWGYVPSWTKDASPQRLINARAESLAEKPSFRDSFKSRRCLVPADAFFEWDAAARPKRAFEFTLENGAPFAFAGIWDEWKGADGKPSRTFAIITRTADETVSPVHDRMPVILSGKDDFAKWLGAPALDFTPPRLAANAIVLEKKAVGDTRQMQLF